MKKLAILGLTILIGSSAFPSSKKDFYECGPFAEVEEYRVGIDVKKQKAGFFNNDSTAILTLTDTHILESLPPQFKMIFEGKEASNKSRLKLYFNLTKKHARLYSVSKNGNEDLIGGANCRNAAPWDLEE